jgi:hypothetical protein
LSRVASSAFAHSSHNIVLLPLPPYAPELNPVENVWEFLRANFLSHCVWDTYDEILDACSDAWNKLMQMPDRIASITRRPWAKLVAGYGGWYECACCCRGDGSSAGPVRLVKSAQAIGMTMKAKRRCSIAKRGTSQAYCSAVALAALLR